GADYTSEHVRRVLLMLGIRHDVCPPYTPEAKPHVERAFGTFTRDLVELLPGYVGHSVADRKAIEDRISMADRHAGKKLHRVRMSVSDFQDFCDAWCRDVYEHDEHRGIGTSPFQRVVQWLKTDMPVRRIENERALDI